MIMDVFTNILVVIVSAYLAGVNALADFINESFIDEPTHTDVTEVLEQTEQAAADDPETVVQKGGTIPDILIQNAAYQQAAVIESIKPEEATSTAYDALVNIYCEHKNGRNIKVSTGTGFFVDTSGIILTNAHVAHFLLMDDIIGDTTCVIRTGNPAEAQYVADLLYISPQWVRDNAGLFASQQPKGTGERDYALLYITGGIDDQPTPDSYPALPFDTELMRTSSVDDTVYVAGYPAESVYQTNARAPLIPKLATTTIAELMTFGSNYADVFSIRGTEVGEHGASGGPVVTQNGNTIGMISTKGDDESFGEGALRAITMSYIDRTIKEETGFGFRQNLAGDIPYRASLFRETIVPFLKITLSQEL